MRGAVAGVDVGSRYTKAVIVDADRRVLGRWMVRTRPDFTAVAREAVDGAAAAAGANPGALAYVATTGFGRYNVPFRDLQITEITCAARGAAASCPEAVCVLDIGFQSTRAIRLRADGRVGQFASNDKCAAGAGGFIERAARYLEVPLEQIGRLSLDATAPEAISSICAVLAETEIINHLTAGVSVENICGGIHRSLATRALGLLKRVGLDGPVAFVGGVALQDGMVRALEETLPVPVVVPPDPLFACAQGAAALGLRRLARLEGYPAEAARPG